ncbi:MAG: DUF2007 domain-containing protein [Prevotellaceae bacterium]|jgi:hypothetical protein|nr:DUF2007 domain-containing protein [Prevotellaceae bacterium]
MSSHLTTVIICHSANEIGLIRSLLESEDIRCYVQDEYIAQVYPLYTGAIGGVKLQVAAADAGRAIEILKASGYAKDKDFEPSAFDIKLYKFLSKIPFIRRIYR